MSNQAALIATCQREIAELKAELEQLKGDSDKIPLAEAAAAAGLTREHVSIRKRRVLKGHYGKVYAVQWAPDSRHLVSVSQDGKLIVWNGLTTNKVSAIPLRSCWMMTCAYAPAGNLVACGGLDNVCSVYKLESKVDPSKPQSVHCELVQHEGYLSCCRFVSPSEILTSSGDGNCILWDVETRTPKNVYDDHLYDVMSVSVDNSKGVFVSGSTDCTAKLWDYRQQKACVNTFTGHQSDVNAVQFFPDGRAFGTGSDDSSCRLFDIRARDQLNKYEAERILCGVTSVAFSLNGRLMFAGYDDYNVQIWDTCLGEICDTLIGHDNRVSGVAMSNNGHALATASWDTLLSIWA